LRHLDVYTLRAALSRMLSLDDDGYLIYQLVVEGAEPAQVAAERGVSRLMLTEQLRDAIDRLGGRGRRQGAAESPVLRSPLSLVSFAHR
jgi:hypothetical protein